ncbi:MAG: Hsp70 family protein [Planctomycetota bacterium]|nr:MAG: Hsp70 family protein [Planctomycetota bacterium]
MTLTSRTIVGIDLGTTNTVVSVIDMERDEQQQRPEVWPVPQFVALGELEPRSPLPSAIYLPAEVELASPAWQLPWGPADAAVGWFAREHGAKVPGRLVTSAKSWLCHRSADPEAPILPLHPAEGGRRISPVDAQRRILEHVARAWDHAYPDRPIETEQLLLTVPASFDVIARSLTLNAAREAGLGELTLLEEPQAAFYAWLDAMGERWREHVQPGDVVLVCDVGGGTTDFSLIGCSERDGNLELERLAVGEHLLLGGDNMDLALAHRLASRLGGDLDPWQSRALWLEAARAKERLLTDPDLERVSVTIAGRGTQLVGAQRQAELERTDIEQIVLEGFFPRVGPEARPVERPRVGLQELGLPYAQDPAITRHLAAFLGRHTGDGQRVRWPTHVLFNGGVMQAPVLRERLLEVLRSWSGKPVETLPGADLADAVARGAAYYGRVRRGRGIRIRGGSARSYYVAFEAAVPAVPGLERPKHAVCVVPFGLEEGSTIEVPGLEFGLVTGAPVEFELYGSTRRKEDRPGQLLERIPDDLERLARLEAILDTDGEDGAGHVVPVGLRARLTEIGTLELYCVARDGSRDWKLEVDLREHRR